MPLFVYPGSGSAPGGTFPSISVATPADRQYDASSSTDGNGVQLPVFTVTGTGTITVTFNFVSNGNGGSFDITASGSATVDDTAFSVTGTLADVNASLQDVFAFPPDGSTGTITYSATVTDSSGNSASLSTPCQLLNSALTVAAKKAETQITVSGTTGTIQLTVQGTAISDVITFQNVDQVATDLANSINAKTSSTKFTAQDLVGGSLSVYGSDAMGGVLNGVVVGANVTGDLAISGGSFSGGETEVTGPQTWVDKISDIAKSALPMAGAGLALGLVNNLLGSAQVQVPVSSSTETPTVSVVYQGKLVNVSNDYDPVSRTYGGGWDGVTFNQVYSTNTAWCALDYLLSTRYGCGSNFKWSSDQLQQVYQQHYLAAQRCDELVSNGSGGTEPRFQLNAVCQGQSKIDTLQAIAGNMLGHYVFPDNTPYLVMDQPGYPNFIVTNANTLNGAFQASGSNMRNSYNYIKVDYINGANNFVSDVAFVYDAADIQTTFERPYEVTAFGVTNVGQALRYGRWIKETENADPLLISWTGLPDHWNLKVGDVVLLVNNHDWFSTSPFNYVQGGRVLSNNGNQFTLDRPWISPSSGYGYFSVQTANGDMWQSNVVGVNGNTVTTQYNFSGLSLADHAIWCSVGSADIEKFTYRIISISEDTNLTYKISAMRYTSDKYSQIDNI
jgi:predicted phage tail protein